MNLISVESVSKSYGEKVLFKDVSFGIHTNHKIALVAKNGTGKSSLLKILAQADVPDSGNVSFKSDIKVAYLSQTDQYDPEKTIVENVIDYTKEPFKTIVAYEKATNDPNTTPEKYDELITKMEVLGAWDFEFKIEEILSKLKFQNIKEKAGNLSGGQIKRLNLAKTLLIDADVYLLDEPTNHLDLEMIEWLEKYLATQSGAFLLITHDRYFLEVVCDEILELDGGSLYKYDGNFSYYLEKRAERYANLQSTIDKAQNLFKKELDWVRRQPKARGTKSKSRVENFHEVKKVAKQRIDDKTMEFLVNPPRVGTKILEFHNVGKSFGDKVIINKFDYLFKKGEKIGVIGNNGVGKSTLIKLILEQEKLDAGKIVIGETIDIGHFSQETIKLKADKKVIEVVKDIAEYVPLKSGKKMSALQLLERFLFSSDMHYQFVSKLSGGEKRKLQLLTVLMRNPNFLILDEPTNDLDIYTLAALEDYLDNFPGCVLIVSHDRYFTDKMVDHIFVFEGNGVVRDFPGNYTQYRVQLKKELSDKKKGIEFAEPKIIAKAPEVKVDKPAVKLTYAEKKELEGIEGEISKLEQKQVEMHEQLSETPEKIKDNEVFFKELGDLTTLIEQKTERWFELLEKKG